MCPGSPKKMVGAAIGNCIHSVRLMRFLNIAKQEGYEITFLGPATPIKKLIQYVQEQNPDIIVVSFRLTPETARELFKDLEKSLVENNVQDKSFILGGTPPVVKVGKEFDIFDFTYTGLERMEVETVREYLSGINGVAKAPVKEIRTLPEYIKLNYPYPLIRHHFGLPSLEETVRGAREIAESRVLDILSIGPDQNAQEYFFHQEEMDRKLDGAGGVPVRTREDLARMYRATRCGNYPLVRCYSGTRDLTGWAEMLKEEINIAWGAVPLSWYSQLDSRSTRTVVEAIRENRETIRWYASHDIPVEVNESHQWALRNTSDTVEVAAAYLASYNAKKLGVKHYIMQYMFNTPPGITMEMDLAKMMAKMELVEALHDESFTSYRMIRTGLASMSTDMDIAKGQLASSIAIGMAIKPHIVHVVGFSEADHIVTSGELIESCKIARGAIENCLDGVPDMSTCKTVADRKKLLIRETLLLIDTIGKISSAADPLTDPATLAKAIKLGLLDAPLLKGNQNAKGSMETAIINGACMSIDPLGNVLSEKERIEELLKVEVAPACR